MKTLTDELDKLRGNICHDCKMKLVPGSVSDPAPSPSRNVATPSTSGDNASSGSSAISAISSSIPSISLKTSETVPDTTIDISATNPAEQIPPKVELPEFSVEFNPEVERILALHLEHVFAHEYPAYCANMSPDGQSMAVGFQYSGRTVIYDMKSRSNVWSVSKCLVSCLD